MNSVSSLSEEIQLTLHARLKKWINKDKDFYVLSDNYSNIKGREQSKDISIVNPTQAAVDQAKSEVKNEKTINRVEKMKYNQTGGNSGKKKSRQSKKKRLLKVKRNRNLLRKRKPAGRIIKRERSRKPVEGHRKVTVQYGCSANIFVSVYATSYR